MWCESIIPNGQSRQAAMRESQPGGVKSFVVMCNLQFPAGTWQRRFFADETPRYQKLGFLHILLATHGVRMWGVYSDLDRGRSLSGVAESRFSAANGARPDWVNSFRHARPAEFSQLGRRKTGNGPSSRKSVIKQLPACLIPASSLEFANGLPVRGGFGP
jgi:hypothetical protein